MTQKERDIRNAATKQRKLAQVALKKAAKSAAKSALDAAVAEQEGE